MAKKRTVFAATAPQIAAVAGVMLAPDGSLPAIAPAVTNEALAVELATLKAAVSQLPDAMIALVNSFQTGYVDVKLGLKADTAALDKKLNKAGDVATGPLMVPVATQAAAATRLEQTYGGLNAPIRFATAVGATPVALLPGPLTDPTPQGRVAKPYLVLLTMRSAPAGGATITVGTTAGGAQVFTKAYTLALLPGLNTVLAPMQPIFIELPAGTTLYAKATAGTWDVEVLSYYKS